jgi:hypothetical protein
MRRAADAGNVVIVVVVDAAAAAAITATVTVRGVSGRQIHSIRRRPRDGKKRKIDPGQGEDQSQLAAALRVRCPCSRVTSRQCGPAGRATNIRTLGRRRSDGRRGLPAASRPSYIFSPAVYARPAAVTNRAVEPGQHVATSRGEPAPTPRGVLATDGGRSARAPLQLRQWGRFLHCLRRRLVRVSKKRTTAIWDTIKLRTADGKNSVVGT